MKIKTNTNVGNSHLGKIFVLKNGHSDSPIFRKFARDSFLVLKGVKNRKLNWIPFTGTLKPSQQIRIIAADAVTNYDELETMF